MTRTDRLGKAGGGANNNEVRESKKGIDRPVFALACMACLFLLLSVAYLEHREVNDARSLAGRILQTSKDVNSYQFSIHSNISMLGESFTLVKGNGSVDYSNGRMAIRLKSLDDSIDLIIANDTAYYRSNDDVWDTKGMHRKGWETYDQLAQNNILLTNSTFLSMEKTDSCFILTALPDSSAVVRDAEMAGVRFKGDEHLKEYSIRYIIDRDSYRINSIESRMELFMNVQGMMTPVTINNRVDIYGYNALLDIEAPQL